MTCPSTLHNEDGEIHPTATVSGVFSTGRLNDRPDEATTYCERCARAAWFCGFFTPDDAEAVERFRQWEQDTLASMTVTNGIEGEPK